MEPMVDLELEIVELVRVVLRLSCERRKLGLRGKL
jgi:hypothetical protein